MDKLNVPVDALRAEGVDPAVVADWWKKRGRDPGVFGASGGPPTRRCRSCGEVKPLDLDHYARAMATIRGRPTPRGWRTTCLACPCQDTQRIFSPCCGCNRRLKAEDFGVNISTGRRRRVCRKCEQSRSDRTRQCARCLEDRALTEFDGADRGKVSRRCRSCEAEVRKACRAMGGGKECRSCTRVKPSSAYTPLPTGRRPWDCDPCRRAKMTAEHQRCSICLRDKPLDAFQPDPRYACGRRTDCRECRSGHRTREHRRGDRSRAPRAPGCTRSR